MTFYAYALWAFVAGALIPLVGIMNAGLVTTLGSPFYAAAAVMATGMCALLLLAVGIGGAPPPLAALGQLRPHYALPGLIMACYIASISYLAPRFGVGNAILCIVIAQIVMSATIDHFGLFDAPHRPMSLLRAGGLMLVVAGLAITQLAARR